MSLNGIGPSGAARLLIEAGDITRFPSKAHFATGTAPHLSTRPPASRSATGSRGRATGRSTGSCTSWPSSSSATAIPKAASYDRKVAAGKTPREAMRCLKRRLPDIV
jgi:transposase